jgi:hypothetical protein
LTEAESRLRTDLGAALARVAALEAEAAEALAASQAARSDSQRGVAAALAEVDALRHEYEAEQLELRALADASAARVEQLEREQVGVEVWSGRMGWVRRSCGRQAGRQALD